MGGELAGTSYPAKTLLNARIPFSNGSDAPVEEPNVMRGMECAVTRRSIGSTDAPYRPEEALTVREAIDSFTKSGAVASFEEGKKGEVANGQLADFVVLPKIRSRRTPTRCTVLKPRRRIWAANAFTKNKTMKIPGKACLCPVFVYNG